MVAIQEVDKRYLKIIGIATVGFVVFLVAYSFFMPVWIISAPYSRGDGILRVDNSVGGWAEVSNEELARIPILKEIDSRTFVPHSESEWRQSLTLVSGQEWNTVKEELQVREDLDNFVLETEKQAIYIDAVHSFIPPFINSERR